MGMMVMRHVVARPCKQLNTLAVVVRAITVDDTMRGVGKINAVITVVI